MSTTDQSKVRIHLLLQRMDQLTVMGFTPDQIAAFLLCEETTGALKPNAPTWTMVSAAFRIERGEAPSLQRFEDLSRMATAYRNLENARTTDFLVDGY